VGIELGARLQRDAGRFDRGDDLAQHHLDTPLLQGLLRVRADRGREHRQERRPGLDEDDAGLVLGDRRIVLGEVAAVQLGQRARRLDAGRPAADHHHVQRPVVDQRRVAVGRVPPLEHLVAEPDGVCQRVHRERVLRRSVDPEEVRLGPEGDDEVVVAERRHVVEGHLAVVEIDRGDRCFVHGGVGLVVEQVAQRVAARRGLQQVGRHLVEQWLERVVVVPVDDRDVDLGVLQLTGGADASEAATQDQDPRALCGRAGTSSTCRVGLGCHRASLLAAPLTTVRLTQGERRRLIWMKFR
jgi:hypothetical protein